MSALNALLDLISEFRPALRGPYDIQRRDDGSIAFQRHKVPTAADVPFEPSNLGTWITSLTAITGGVIVFAIAVVGLTPFLDRVSNIWSGFLEWMLTTEPLRWLLLAALAVSVIFAAVRQRRRPREIVFDPAHRELRMIPGQAVPFTKIDGVHALTWRDLTQDAPVERFRVYVRVRGQRITLAEPQSRQAAEDLAADLNKLLAPSNEEL